MSIYTSVFVILCVNWYTLSTLYLLFFPCIVKYGKQYFNKRKINTAS